VGLLVAFVFAERENELLAASKGSQVQDMTALVERLKKSERLVSLPRLGSSAPDVVVRMRFSAP